MQPRLSPTECRRTLRRLELEAYGSLVTVLRAQGALVAERRQLLEAVRDALHIGPDRHSAEARRVSNDELLANIAEQVSGPNTGLGWVKEGRRKIPILPRGIPQTIYTAIADKAAMKALEENDRIVHMKLERQNEEISESAVEIPEDELPHADATDDKAHFKTKKEYPPIVMCDQSLKMLNDEGPPRKRSRQDAPTFAHRATQQKHHNLSKIYLDYSKHGKISNQFGRNSYGQGGKIGNKSNTPKSSISKHRSIQKHSAAKHCGQVAIPHHQVRTGIKSPTDPHIAGSQALTIQNQLDNNNMKSQAHAYQANYAQPPVQNVSMDEANNEIKLPVGSTILSDTTMQLIAQTPNQHDTSVSLPECAEDSGEINQNAPMNPKIPQSCHIIIKNKNENPLDSPQSEKKIQINKQVIKKQDLSSIKVLQNRPVVIATSNTNPKLLNSSGKLITTKLVQHIPSKSQVVNAIAPNQGDKVVMFPKSPLSAQGNVLQRNVGNTPFKNVILSTHGINTNKDAEKPGDGEGKNIIINSDLKLTTKTFLINSNSGQKMVVLPNKRPKTIAGQSVPLFQMKGVQGKASSMKLVPVNRQSVNSQSNSNNITVLSNVISSPKVISKDSINPFKPDGKVMSPIQLTSKVLKQPLPAKSNLIVVQKAPVKAPIPLKPEGKASKIVVDLHQNEVLFTSGSVSNRDECTPAYDEADKTTFEGNESDEAPIEAVEKPDESIESSNLFGSQAVDDCNTDSVESVTECLLEGSNVDSSMKSDDSFEPSAQADKTENQTVLSNFTDWEAELASAADKQNSTNKISELNLELEMSSDSDVGSFVQKASKEEDTSQDEQEDTNEIGYASRTLLSQLQDDGSSSNDSPFVLTKTLDAGRLELLESSQTSSSAME